MPTRYIPTGRVHNRAKYGAVCPVCQRPIHECCDNPCLTVDQADADYKEMHDYYSWVRKHRPKESTEAMGL